MAQGGMKNVLMSADQIAEQKDKIYRDIPTAEKPWWREGHVVRIKLSQIEPGLPEGVSAVDVNRWRLVRYDGRAWQEIPVHVDLANGFEGWAGAASLDTALWFHAPASGVPTDERWPGATKDDILVPVMLWDSWRQSRCEGAATTA